MDGAGAKAYFLSLPGAFEDFPFGPDVHVFKVNNKMFGTLGYEAGLARVNLKCDPDQAIFLRQLHSAVLPGYHMNKRHWNTVLLDQSIPLGEVQRLIDHSYALVVKSLRKSERVAMEIKYGADALYRA